MLAVSWDGSTWSLQPTPNASARRSFSPRAIACTSVRACTAAGSVNRFGVQQTLAIHWDGIRWAIQATPLLPKTASPLLLGVACRPASVCLAAGHRFNPGGLSRTLADRHS